MIHSLEFFDEAGAVIGRVNANVNPRAGSSRDIHIAKDEQIVGIQQLQSYGTTRALGFICMHTGDGYPQTKVDLNSANELPPAALQIVDVGPHNAYVTTSEPQSSDNSHHNLI